ncbi:deoxyribodipyrimidine photo-lyase, partial [Streptomyces sp. NPDC005534]|uniref:deoxyribodipyrimidine photo-lyase n=1 Tax=Streptomyces sp. NPDC005534 TaxID=3155714 RepID=UPI003451A7A2
MTLSIVLFTSDLRLHDHPPLRAALDGSDAVVPLFVRDEAVAEAGFTAPNRMAFLADCLTDLDAGLRERGGRLVVRSGEVVAEVCKVVAEADADEVHMAAGVSAYAHRREERLRAALEAEGRRLHVHETVVTAVAPGAVTPASSDHFAVFTPYHRQWARQPLRDAVAAKAVVSRAPKSTWVRRENPGVAARSRGEGAFLGREPNADGLLGEIPGEDFGLVGDSGGRRP